MVNQKKLSDTEFEVMKAVWNSEEPVTTNAVMDLIGKARNWKLPTIMTLMKRLIEKGYLRSEKPAKERIYYSLVTRDEYLAWETKDFMKLYHENSFSSFVSTLYKEKELTEQDLNELTDILKRGDDNV